MVHIAELESTITFFKASYAYNMPVYWLLLLVASIILLCMIIKRRFDIQDIVMLAGLGYFSFTTVRYIAFFLIWATPFIALSLTRIIDSSVVVTQRATLNSRKLLPIYVSVALSFFIVTVLIIKQADKKGQISAFYPKEAVDFIIQNDIKGNMFNHYDWGGYLIWRFYPEKKVFIDGRNLYEFQYSQWGSIMNAIIEPEVMGKSCYKALLDSYKVRYMLIPLFMPGGMPPIVSEVIKDKEWFPVFLSNNSMVFIKDTTENHDLIKRYAIPKEIFVNKLSEVINKMMIGHCK